MNTEKDSLRKKFTSYLIENNFQAGDPLSTELELAEKFAVSRGTMRELIMYFSYLGILKRVKNSGTHFCKFSYQKLEEIMFFCFQLSGFNFEELKETRLYMEAGIIPLIIKRLAPQDIENLRNNIKEMLENSDNAERADELDREFHLMLFKICRNRILSIFSNVILLLFRREFREKFFVPETVKNAALMHQELLETIIAEDTEKARSLIRSHILRS